MAGILAGLATACLAALVWRSWFSSLQPYSLRFTWVFSPRVRYFEDPRGLGVLVCHTLAFGASLLAAGFPHGPLARRWWRLATPLLAGVLLTLLLTGIRALKMYRRLEVDRYTLGMFMTVCCHAGWSLWWAYDAWQRWKVAEGAASQDPG